MYEIIKTEQKEDFIFTTVKFDFMDEEITISHFQPESKEAVILGIENRMASEKRKADAIENNKKIIEELK